ncbi:MAG: TetR/AcrR family transcriptional regulator [Spirochaetales bacterium]|nr:TetR/AcrR family transcriptional regulator [Spirochaetales bacterium]
MPEEDRRFIRATNAEAREIKRRALMKAALASFVERGYDRTTVSAVTKAAGESVGTFYLYFENKLQVYRSLYREALEMLRRHLEEAMRKPHPTVTGEVRALALSYLEFSREKRDYYLILSSQHLGQQDFINDGFLKDRLDTEALALLKMIDRILRRGIDGGEFRRHDTWKTTMIFWGMMDGLLLLNERSNLALSNSGLEDLVLYSVDLCLRGISIS